MSTTYSTTYRTRRNTEAVRQDRQVVSSMPMKTARIRRFSEPSTVCKTVPVMGTLVRIQFPPRTYRAVDGVAATISRLPLRRCDGATTYSTTYRPNFPQKRAGGAR